MNSRTRSRTQASIGSNQSSKRYTAVSATGCEESCFVLMLFMAWSPTGRFNVGRFEVEHPGDYATFNSNQLRDGTLHNGNFLSLLRSQRRKNGRKEARQREEFH